MIYPLADKIAIRDQITLYLFNNNCPVLFYDNYGETALPLWAVLVVGGVSAVVLMSEALCTFCQQLWVNDWYQQNQIAIGEANEIEIISPSSQIFRDMCRRIGQYHIPDGLTLPTPPYGAMP